MPTLTIGIPTFCRALKLERLLHALTRQIEQAGVSDRVTILVSDNASEDDTPGVFERARVAHPGVKLEYVRQPRNIGPAANFEFVYRHGPAPRVWLFGDDDLPTEGALSRILAAIDAHDPDVIVCGFEQPPGTLLPVVPPGTVEVVSEYGPAAPEAVVAATKLSAYILRRVAFGPRNRALMDHGGLPHGFPHCMLALCILDESKRPRTVMLGPAVASADEDFSKLRADPRDWRGIADVCAHPYVVRNAPRLASTATDRGYSQELNVLWAWRSGAYEIDASVEDGYWEILQNLPFRWRTLAANPSDLALYAILRLEPRRLPSLVSRLRKRLAALRSQRRA